MKQFVEDLFCVNQIQNGSQQRVWISTQDNGYLSFCFQVIRELHSCELCFSRIKLELKKGPIYQVLQTMKTPGGKCFYCLQSLQKPHPSSDWIMALIVQFQIQSMKFSSSFFLQLGYCAVNFNHDFLQAFIALGLMMKYCLW